MKSRGTWTPEQIDGLFEGLGSRTARVKYGAAKALKMVSEQAPDLLYPRWDTLVRLLENDNAFRPRGVAR